MMKIQVLNRFHYRDKTLIERALPDSGQIYVKVGQEINSFDEVGECIPPKEEKIIDYTGKLLIELGETLEQGTKISSYRKNFLKTDYIISDVRGKVLSINLQERKLLVAAESNLKVYKLIAGVRGKILDIQPNQSVLIEAPALTMKGLMGVGSEVFGELVYIEGENSICTDKDIDTNITRKIVVAHKITSGAVSKASALGASGFVVSSCSYDDFRQYSKLNISFLVFNAFGNVNFNAKSTDYFKSLKSKYCILRSYDYSLIVPGQSDLKNFPVAKDMWTGFEADVTVGDLVQVFSSDSYARICKVKKITDDKVVVELDNSVELSLSPEKVGLVG